VRLVGKGIVSGNYPSILVEGVVVTIELEGPVPKGVADALSMWLGVDQMIWRTTKKELANEQQ